MLLSPSKKKKILFHGYYISFYYYAITKPKLLFCYITRGNLLQL